MFGANKQPFVPGIVRKQGRNVNNVRTIFVEVAPAVGVEGEVSAGRILFNVEKKWVISRCIMQYQERNLVEVIICDAKYDSRVSVVYIAPSHIVRRVEHRGSKAQEKKDLCGKEDAEEGGGAGVTIATMNSNGDIPSHPLSMKLPGLYKGNARDRKESSSSSSSSDVKPPPPSGPSACRKRKRPFSSSSSSPSSPAAVAVARSPSSALRDQQKKALPPPSPLTSSTTRRRKAIGNDEMVKGVTTKNSDMKDQLYCMYEKSKKQLHGVLTNLTALSSMESEELSKITSRNPDLQHTLEDVYAAIAAATHGMDKDEIMVNDDNDIAILRDSSAAAAAAAAAATGDPTAVEKGSPIARASTSDDGVHRLEGNRVLLTVATEACRNEELEKSCPNPKLTRIRPPKQAEDEDVRLGALRSLKIMGTEEEEVFDNILWMAVNTCEAQVGGITFVDKDKQFFKSTAGNDDINTRFAPRDRGFSPHCIQHPKKIFIIRDSHKDERFAEKPLEIRGVHVRFYVGIPIGIGIDGGIQYVGTLTVGHRRPKDLTDDQKAMLLHLARMTQIALISRRTRIETKKFTYFEDASTGGGGENDNTNTESGQYRQQY
mmetsp:Transcript_15221/g.21283  ORF Transcript_15221/g.21283 Transcript_15221/m.21283 type:complete len:601 (+) Transcript_15221:217-2019(+)